MKQKEILQYPFQVLHYLPQIYWGPSVNAMWDKGQKLGAPKYSCWKLEMTSLSWFYIYVRKSDNKSERSQAVEEYK